MGERLTFDFSLRCSGAMSHHIATTAVPRRGIVRGSAVAATAIGANYAAADSCYLPPGRGAFDPADVERIPSRALHSLDITVATGTSSTSAISV